MIDQLLYEYAISLLGTPYRWGGDDPLQGFDCSGLVIELLQSAGVLPYGFDTTSQGLYDLFKKQGVLSEKTFGSLAFFGRGSISHVGFMLDDFRMIEAGGGDSRTITTIDAAKNNAFVRIRPLTWRSDLVALIMPDYSKLIKP